MIKPYNTTTEHTHRALTQGREPKSRLRARLSSLTLMSLFITPLTLTPLTRPVYTLPLSASPLERFKLLFKAEERRGERRGERREESSFEVSARSLAWSEGAQALSLKGEVRLWRTLKTRVKGKHEPGGEGEVVQRVELRCEALEARFHPQRAQRPAGGSLHDPLEGLMSLTLTGGVSLSAPGLSLTARRAHWEASEGLLRLTGGVEGRWGAQRVHASHAQVWLERGSLIAEGVRATLKFPRRLAPRVSLER